MIFWKIWTNFHLGASELVCLGFLSAEGKVQPDFLGHLSMAIWTLVYNTELIITKYFAVDNISRLTRMYTWKLR